jgi:hypothetical protein
MKSPTGKCRTAGKVLLWVVGILVVLRVLLSVGGVAITNRVLPGILGTAASIESADMGLLRGRVSVGGIQIFQPLGFEGAPLFSLGTAAVNVSLPSLLNGPLTVESVMVDRLELNLIRNQDGLLNIAALAGGDTNAPLEEAEDETESDPSPPKAVAVQKLNVRALSISYRDLSYDPPLAIHVAECNVSVTNLLFDPFSAGEPLLDSTVSLTALLKQPDFHDGYVGLVARLGVLSTNAPPTVAAIRIVGLELKSGLDAVVPPGVAQTLGGNCVDAYADLAMAVDILDLKARIKTEDNTMPFAVGGMPSAPRIDKSTALFSLVSRPTMLVGGVVTDVSSAGVEVVEGAAKTTAAVGKGALKVVGSLGKGVFKTAKGVATADLGGISDGLKTATVGTVTEVAEGIVDTATAAVEGVGETATAAIGKDETDAWRAGCEVRWEKLWKEARSEVAAAPYPRPEAETKATEEPVEAVVPEVAESVTNRTEEAGVTNETEEASATNETAEASEPTPVSRQDL